MKKFILILLLIPFACKAQDQHVMSTEDILINVVLENTANYLEHRNDIDPTENLKVTPKKDSIDWNNMQLIK